MKITERRCIVTPNVGVTYSGSTKKLAEHGGFSRDDTNVMILVSNPSLAPKVVTSAVETAQVAPTILKALGLDPKKLDASKARRNCRDYRSATRTTKTTNRN